MRIGDVLGHEFMGIIDAVGPAVKNFKKGDRAVASFEMGCGQCYFCKHEQYSSCDTTNPRSVLALWACDTTVCPIIYTYGHVGHVKQKHQQSCILTLPVHVTSYCLGKHAQCHAATCLIVAAYSAVKLWRSCMATGQVASMATLT